MTITIHIILFYNMNQLNKNICVKVGDICFNTSNPCQHTIILIIKNTESQLQFCDGKTIKNIFKKYKLEIPKHFEKY